MSKKQFSIDSTKLNLELLSHIWRLTKSKKLIWKKDDLGYFHSSYENIKAKIEFYNFQRMDERSSDDTIGEIEIEILDSGIRKALIFEYSIGTKGFDLLKKMVYFNNKSSRESWIRLQKRKISMIDYLSKLK